jgi:hypothetical protein
MLSKIVVVTAAAESFYRECMELQSVHAIMRKPFDVDQLEDVLRRMLKEPAASPRKMRADSTMRLKIV